MSSWKDFSPDDQALLEALQSAWGPRPLPEDEAEARLAAALFREEHQDLHEALGAAWAPTALDEEEGAARIAAALETEDDAAFVAALQSAISPSDLPLQTHEALVARALASAAPAPRAEEPPAPPRGVLVRFLPRVAAAATAFAIAAGVLVTVRTAPPATISVASGDALVASEALTTPGARTERMARARAADFRENRFRSFGLAPAPAGRGAR